VSRRRLSIALLLTLPLWLAQDGIALADNCGSPSDCFFTERAAILALIGIATLAALFIFGPGAAVATLFLASDVAGLLTGRDVLTWKKAPRWQTALGMIDPTPGNVGTRGGKRLVTEGVEETSAEAAKRGLRKTDIVPKGGTWTVHAVLDGTGKVHGKLPKPADLGKYGPEDLATLRDHLQQSVQKRIQKTVELGSDSGHSARIAEEQALIKSIEKHLADR